MTEPILRALESFSGDARLLITIDGPCASGKTTMAGELARTLNSPVVHTDDYVVPHGLKTAERLSQPGGNADWERLIREVLEPWRGGKESILRRYDCHRDCLLPGEALLPDRHLILEGCYANLPAIRRLADLRVFLDIPRVERMRRLRARETEEALQMYQNRWIPLENAYFEAYHLPDSGCLVLTDEEQRTK